MLMVYNEGCNAIAKCSQPGPEAAMRYSLKQQAWVWDGHAHCSMLLYTPNTKQQFEGAPLSPRCCLAQTARQAALMLRAWAARMGVEQHCDWKWDTDL